MTTNTWLEKSKKKANIYDTSHEYALILYLFYAQGNSQDQRRLSFCYLHLMSLPTICPVSLEYMYFFFFFFCLHIIWKGFPWDFRILHVYQLQFPWSLTGRVGDFNSRNWAVSNHTLRVSTSFFRSLSYSPYISSVWAAEASSAQSFLTQELFPASDHSYCLFLNLI